MLVLLLALPIGVLIGVVGLGGLLLVPLLAELGHYGEHEAIGLSLASFVALGAIGFIERFRTGTPPARSELMLYAAMIPAAAAGTFAIAYIPEHILALVIALSIATTGLWTVFAPNVGGTSPLPSNPLRVTAYGAIAGAGSALTGTGGPLVLMPLLIAEGVAIRETISIARASQLPIALTATITRARTATLNIPPAIMLSTLMIIGMLIGTKLATQVPAKTLQKAVAWLLTITGAYLTYITLSRG